MRSTVWQAFAVYILRMIILVHAGRRGTVLFMKAKNNISMLELYEGIGYTDYYNTTKHFWNITDLMVGSNTFRSPLLDRQVELDMTDFEIIVYNAVGEVMTSFPYTMDSGTPVSTSGTLSIDGPTSVLLHSFNDDDMARFITINVQSTEPSGTQFILTTDDGFHSLPERISLGCYNFTSGSLFANITETMETDSGGTCVAQCITEMNSTFALAFTAINHTTNVHRCACVPDMGSSTYATKQNVIKCPDDTDCGCAIYYNGDSTVIASLYNMSQTNTFLNDLTTRTRTTETVEVFTPYPYITLSQRTFIVKISCQDCPQNLTYKLGFSIDDNCDSTSSFTFYGKGLGSDMTFNTSEAMNIHPTPATCLNFDFLSDIEASYVFELNVLTDTFIKGKFLRIVGYWNNPECRPEPVLQNATSIPDTWVTVVQIDTPSTYASHWNNLTFPEMSAGVINITIPSNTNRIHIIQVIEVSVDVEANITYVVNSYDECVVIGTGSRYNQSYNSVVNTNVTQNGVYTIPIPDVCAYNVSFMVNSTNPTGNVSQRVNTLTFKIYGCVIYDWNTQALCSPVEITDNVMGAANVSWYWIPHPVRAVTYLRPGGPGLVLYRYADPYIIIGLDKRWVPIEVTRVLITGDVVVARITIGNTTAIINNGTGTMLDYKPTDVRGHQVLIDNIIGRMDIPAADPNFEFPLIHVDVEVCVLNFPSVTTYLTSTAPSTTTQTTSPASSATPLSTSTIAAQSLSSSSTTAAAITQAIPTFAQQPSTTVTTSTIPNTESLTTTNLDNPPITIANQDILISTHTHSSTTSQPSTLEATITTSPTSTSSKPGTTTASQSSTSSTNTSPSSAASKPGTTTSSPSSTSSTTTSPTSTTSKPGTTTASPSSTSSTTTSASTINSTQTTAGTKVTPTPNACCLCFSNTVNLTKTEVDVLVQELVRNLTVPKRKTSAYKRSLESAPDTRVSARMVGSVGIAMMTLTGGLILAMDFTHIVGVLKFLKHVIVSPFIG